MRRSPARAHIYRFVHLCDIFLYNYILVGKMRQCFSTRYYLKNYFRYVHILRIDAWRLWKLVIHAVVHSVYAGQLINVDIIMSELSPSGAVTLVG